MNKRDLEEEYMESGLRRLGSIVQNADPVS